MLSKRLARAQKYRARQRELSILDVQWMARRGELLPSRPIEVDDRNLSSHLFGPKMKTVQMERIEVLEVEKPMKTIRLNVSISGLALPEFGMRDFNFSRGQVVEIDDRLARKWIKSYIAEPHDG